MYPSFNRVDKITPLISKRRLINSLKLIQLKIQNRHNFKQR